MTLGRPEPYPVGPRLGAPFAIVSAGRRGGRVALLTVAADAGRAVQTDTGAYGQLCQFVPALLNQLQQAMVDGMTTAATSVHEIADALRSVAAACNSADTVAADRLREFRNTWRSRVQPAKVDELDAGIGGSRRKKVVSEASAAEQQ